MLRRYADFLDDMSGLAASAPEVSVCDACVGAVIERGCKHQRRLMEQTVQLQLDVAEEKGRR